jgi:hypothetical protein
VKYTAATVIVICSFLVWPGRTTDFVYGYTVPQEPRAVLLSGPETGTGVPALGPNALRWYKAVYRYRSDTRVWISYIPDYTTVPDQGTVVRCPAGPVYRLETEDYVVMYRNDDRAGQRWSLLIEIDGDPGEVCRIVDGFIESFVFFREAVGDNDPAPFPAAF